MNKDLQAQASSEEKINTPALIAEYQACHSQMSAAGTRMLQVTAIFLTVVAGALAFVAQVNVDSPWEFGALAILGGALVYFAFWWNDYIGREEYIYRVLYTRMMEIERELGLYTVRYDRFLDKDGWNAREKDAEWKKLSTKEKRHFKALYETVKGPGYPKWARTRVIRWLVLAAYAVAFVLKLVPFVIASLQAGLKI